MRKAGRLWLAPLTLSRTKNQPHMFRSIARSSLMRRLFPALVASAVLALAPAAAQAQQAQIPTIRNTAGSQVQAQGVVCINIDGSACTWMVPRGTANIATGQVSVATSSTLVVAGRAGRGKVILSVGAANTCSFGNSGVTTATGFPLQPTAGASLALDSAAAIYAACSATTTVSYVEQF